MSVRLALVQPIAHAPPHDELNIAEAVATVGKAADASADFVVFPESYPGPWQMPATFDPSAAIVDAAAQRGVHVVWGSLEPIDETEGTAYQVVCLARPDGGAPGIYRRTHPPGPWIYDEWEPWRFRYVAGDEFPVFETEQGIVGLAVCSEVYMPEVTRALALRGAELILLPAGTDKLELRESWRTLIQARAIENLAVTVTTQNVFSQHEPGLAMVASPEGVLFETAAPGMFCVDVDLERIRELRAQEDGPSSRHLVKAGVLTQWQRPELYGR